MSHYAQVKNSIVQQVIVAEQDFIATLPDSKDWVQTSYNTCHNQHALGGEPLRGNFAGIGYTYDAANDVFIPPKPYASFRLNMTTWSWDAPVPRPTDGAIYFWDEDTQNWKQ